MAEPTVHYEACAKHHEKLIEGNGGWDVAYWCICPDLNDEVDRTLTSVRVTILDFYSTAPKAANPLLRRLGMEEV